MIQTGRKGPRVCGPDSTCAKCGGLNNPNVPSQALVWCFAELYNSNNFLKHEIGCRLWFHPGCVGRLYPPEHQWLCKSCANGNNRVDLVIGTGNHSVQGVVIPKMYKAMPLEELENWHVGNLEKFFPPGVKEYDKSTRAYQLTVAKDFFEDFDYEWKSQFLNQFHSLSSRKHVVARVRKFAQSFDRDDDRYKLKDALANIRQAWLDWLAVIPEMVADTLANQKKKGLKRHTHEQIEELITAYKSRVPVSKSGTDDHDDGFPVALSGEAYGSDKDGSNAPDDNPESEESGSSKEDSKETGDKAAAGDSGSSKDGSSDEQKGTGEEGSEKASSEEDEGDPDATEEEESDKAESNKTDATEEEECDKAESNKTEEHHSKEEDPSLGGPDDEAITAQVDDLVADSESGRRATGTSDEVMAGLMDRLFPGRLTIPLPPDFVPKHHLPGLDPTSLERIIAQVATQGAEVTKKKQQKPTATDAVPKEKKRKAPPGNGKDKRDKAMAGSGPSVAKVIVGTNPSVASLPKSHPQQEFGSGHHFADGEEAQQASKDELSDNEFADLVEGGEPDLDTKPAATGKGPDLDKKPAAKKSPKVPPKRAKKKEVEENDPKKKLTPKQRGERNAAQQLGKTRFLAIFDDTPFAKQDITIHLDREGGPDLKKSSLDIPNVPYACHAYAKLAPETQNVCLGELFNLDSKIGVKEYMKWSKRCKRREVVFDPLLSKLEPQTEEEEKEIAQHRKQIINKLTLIRRVHHLPPHKDTPATAPPESSQVLHCFNQLIVPHVLQGIKARVESIAGPGSADNAVVHFLSVSWLKKMKNLEIEKGRMIFKHVLFDYADVLLLCRPDNMAMKMKWWTELAQVLVEKEINVYPPMKNLLNYMNPHAEDSWHFLLRELPRPGVVSEDWCCVFPNQNLTTETWRKATWEHVFKMAMKRLIKTQEGKEDNVKNHHCTEHYIMKHGMAIKMIGKPVPIHHGRAVYCLQPVTLPGEKEPTVPLRAALFNVREPDKILTDPPHVFFQTYMHA